MHPANIKFYFPLCSNLNQLHSIDPSPSLSFSEDFAQFAQSFRWRLQARDSRGQRIALNESRLRARRLRGRHTPYSSLWDRGPSPGPRHDALLAEFADIAPRPSLSGDSASPIVIDDEVKRILIILKFEIDILLF